MILIDSKEPKSIIKVFDKVRFEEKIKREKSKTYAKKYKLFNYKVQQIVINGVCMGDYSDEEKWIIERKTESDLINSLKSGRAYGQLEDISQFDGIRVFMLQGSLDNMIKEYPERIDWIVSFSVLCARYGVHFWEASDERLFVEKIKWLDRYADKIIEPILRKQFHGKQPSRGIAILSEFSDIGPHKAKLLLEGIGTLSILFYYAIDRPQLLLQIEGIGKACVKSLQRELLKVYNGERS